MSGSSDERTLMGLRVRIDRDLCVGFGECVDLAPETFQLDADDVAVFTSAPDGVDRERLVRACEVCPVDALTVWDASGAQIVP